MPQRLTRRLVIQLDRDGGACDGEIPVPAGELFNREARPRTPHREAHGSEDLVGCHRVLPQAGEELARRDLAGAARRHRFHLRVERQRHRGILRRRIGVGDRAAERAAGTDLEVADVWGRQRQQWHRVGHLVVHPDEGVRRGRPDANFAVAQVDSDELVDPRDVDEVVEMREPHGEHGHQALTAGEDLRVVAVLGEQIDSLL